MKKLLFALVMALGACTSSFANMMFDADRQIWARCELEEINAHCPPDRPLYRSGQCLSCDLLTDISVDPMDGCAQYTKCEEICPNRGRYFRSGYETCKLRQAPSDDYVYAFGYGYIRKCPTGQVRNVKTNECVPCEQIPYEGINAARPECLACPDTGYGKTFYDSDYMRHRNWGVCFKFCPDERPVPPEAAACTPRCPEDKPVMSKTKECLTCEEARERQDTEIFNCYFCRQLRCEGWSPRTIHFTDDADYEAIDNVRYHHETEDALLRSQSQAHTFIRWIEALIVFLGIHLFFRVLIINAVIETFVLWCFKYRKPSILIYYALLNIISNCAVNSIYHITHTETVMFVLTLEVLAVLFEFALLGLKTGYTKRVFWAVLACNVISFLFGVWVFLGL